VNHSLTPVPVGVKRGCPNCAQTALQSSTKFCKQVATKHCQWLSTKSAKKMYITAHSYAVQTTKFVIFSDLGWLMMMVDGDNSLMIMIGCPRTPSPSSKKSFTSQNLKTLIYVKLQWMNPNYLVINSLYWCIHSVYLIITQLTELPTQNLTRKPQFVAWK